MAILLFTDFGRASSYVGEMHSRVAALAPGIRTIDLLHDAPRFAPEKAGALLAALAEHFVRGSVIVGVVDPGVGTDARLPVVVRTGGCWFVGPCNGLFDAVAAADENAQWGQIEWRPERLSVSFHGRDLFIPVAARLGLSASLDIVGVYGAKKIATAPNIAAGPLPAAN